MVHQYSQQTILQFAGERDQITYILRYLQETKYSDQP